MGRARRPRKDFLAIHDAVRTWLQEQQWPRYALQVSLMAYVPGKVPQVTSGMSPGQVLAGITWAIRREGYDRRGLAAYERLAPAAALQQTSEVLA